MSPRHVQEQFVSSFAFLELCIKSALHWPKADVQYKQMNLNITTNETYDKWFLWFFRKIKKYYKINTNKLKSIQEELLNGNDNSVSVNYYLTFIFGGLR